MHLIRSVLGTVMVVTAIAIAWVVSNHQPPREISVTAVAQPTLSLNLFGALTSLTDPVPQVDLIKLDPIEKIVILGNTDGLVGVNIRTTNLEPVPAFGQMIRNPCEVGKQLRLVGYSFVWQGGMTSSTKGYHPAIDVNCYKPGEASQPKFGEPIYAPLPGIVWRKAFISPSSSEAIRNWVSGYVCIVKSNIGGTEILSVMGHFAPFDETTCPEPGTPVDHNTLVGRIDSTGYSTGPHLHIGFAVLTEAGDYVWVNPEQLGILGSTRLADEFYDVSAGDICQIPVIGVVEAARKVALSKGIPTDVFLSLLLTESSLKPCSPNGQPLINWYGAIGVGQVVPRWHPHLDPNLLANDLEYSLNASADILIEYAKLTGSWESGVGKYKSSPAGTKGYNLWQQALQRGGFTDLETGMFISFK